MELEGFPMWTPKQFVRYFCDLYGLKSLRLAHRQAKRSLQDRSPAVPARAVEPLLEQAGMIHRLHDVERDIGREPTESRLALRGHVAPSRSPEADMKATCGGLRASPVSGLVRQPPRPQA